MIPVCIAVGVALLCWWAELWPTAQHYEPTSTPKPPTPAPVVYVPVETLNEHADHVRFMVPLDVVETLLQFDLLSRADPHYYGVPYVAIDSDWGGSWWSVKDLAQLPGSIYAGRNGFEALDPDLDIRCSVCPSCGHSYVSKTHQARCWTV